MFVRPGSVFIRAVFFAAIAANVAVARDGRQVINLDGTWEITQGKMDTVPEKFDRRVPVPGLADMAKPPFKNVGFKNDLREAFWYRRTFRVDGDVPGVAILKVGKAKYGTRVYLNGKLVGDHLPCFTPALFGAREQLKGGAENVLIVRVGALRDSVPPKIPTGWDFEKYRYIPGIYDSVELTLTGTPHIVNVQTVPDIEKRRVRVVAELSGGEKKKPSSVKYSVREAKSGKVVADGETDGAAKLDFQIPIPNCRLWSPEDPFLYQLELDTGGDTYHTRFGMRSFRFDPATGRAVLNGKPYFMRGTNVCILRFFEDDSRGDLPWRKDWVRKLHQKFKGMHWNSIRYCIGFPPEFWYDIADEEGLLIQDEFPIWTLGDRRQTGSLDAEEIVREYTEWMRERWNHPCVVIWDAQNESRTPATGKALTAVRGLDLSGRPWDNGWGQPQAETDCQEQHPYRFINSNFLLRQMAGDGGIRSRNKNPIINNEYAWLWLNRDGTPTVLTRKLYDNLLGPDHTTEQRRMLYARYLAALTEFWRCRRQCAGVLHFCGLGYSRPGPARARPVGGATSDHFIDLEKLDFEPLFEQYVRDAFAPVGLMIDEWADQLPPASEREIPVVVINDLPEQMPVMVNLRLLRGNKIISEQSKECTIGPLGQKVVKFKIIVPNTSGKYQLVAELTRDGVPAVRSLRDFEVITAEDRKKRAGVAAGCPVTASSNLTTAGATNPAAATDGNAGTRWSSAFSDPQWIAIDLGKETNISRIKLLWEAAYGKAYSIEVSPDGKTWKEIYKTDKGNGGTDDIKFPPTPARHVRLTGTRRGTEFGYSLWEFQVFP